LSTCLLLILGRQRAHEIVRQVVHDEVNGGTADASRDEPSAEAGSMGTPEL